MMFAFILLRKRPARKFDPVFLRFLELGLLYFADCFNRKEKFQGLIGYSQKTVIQIELLRRVIFRINEKADNPCLISDKSGKVNRFRKKPISKTFAL